MKACITYTSGNTLREISDKHAPLRKLSHKKKKQLNKPWTSNAILKSIKIIIIIIIISIVF